MGFGVTRYTFALRLEQYLQERKVTLHKFVKDTGIPRSTLTNLTTGHTKSSTLATLYQVADGLGITVLEFLDCDLFREKNILID